MAMNTVIFKLRDLHNQLIIIQTIVYQQKIYKRPPD